MGLALYPENALERMHVQMCFGQQLLELGVLRLRLTQPLRIGYFLLPNFERHL